MIAKTFSPGNTVYCSCLKKAGRVAEKKDYTWLYNVVVEFEGGSVSQYTYDGRFDIDGQVCLERIPSFYIGDEVEDVKGRFFSTAVVYEIDLDSHFPIKVTDGKIKRAYTIDGRYDFNAPIELIKKEDIDGENTHI